MLNSLDEYAKRKGLTINIANSEVHLTHMALRPRFQCGGCSASQGLIQMPRHGFP